MDKVGSAMSRHLDMITKQARVMFRTVGPRIPDHVYPEDRVHPRLCLRCDPEPEVYECPACNYQTHDRWRLSLHFRVAPKYCSDLSAKRARGWARNA